MPAYTLAFEFPDYIYHRARAEAVDAQRSSKLALVHWVWPSDERQALADQRATMVELDDLRSQPHDCANYLQYSESALCRKPKEEKQLRS